MAPSRDNDNVYDKLLRKKRITIFFSSANIVRFFILQTLCEGKNDRGYRKIQ